MKRFQRLFVFSVVAVAAVPVVPTTQAQDGGVEAQPPARCLTLDNFLQWDPASLEALYRSLDAGSPPAGSFAGKASPEPGSRSGVRQSRRIGFVWKGKEFPGNDIMINRLPLGLKAIRADVYYGDSYLDGRPTIILDYANTSRLFATARDEMREVSPGLYLGITYVRECPGPKRAAFYVVQQLPTCSGK
jgi:hypothetical protein